ncbi:MAG: TrmB family transcriptional regulator [Thaumarchaeota archaeon]|nr:TrmB family transcriptional regulator [Nitrososphaerota archaeon]
MQTTYKRSHTNPKVKSGYALSVSERAKRALGGIGLTGYEIKAYTSLIEFGSMTAAEVSKRSGVPYSKIYDVLGTLESKGWIEADRSRPSKFYPKSPATALETTKMRLESERAKNEEVALKDLTPLYEKRGVKELPEIWIIRGEFNILAKVKETLDTCEKELMIALPPILDGFGSTLIPIVAALKERGLHVKIMVSSGTSPDFLRSLSRQAEVRLRDQMFGGGVIADDKQVVLLLGGEGVSDPHLAIWADHLGLARLARGYFGYLWDESLPLKEASVSTSR